MKRIDKAGTAFFGALTLVLISGQIFRCPGSVIDLATGVFPEGVRLAYPFLYTLFAPFFQFADHWSILSFNQHLVFLAYVTIGWLAFRAVVFYGMGLWTLKRLFKETGKFLLFLLAFLLMVALMVLVPRPMARLEVSDPDTMAIDFHSHTKYSWDANRFFSPRKNLLWHKRAGFHAAFITDHNVFEGTKEGYDISRQDPSMGIVAMKGEEVSLHRSHWVLLGIDEVFPNSEYDLDILKIKHFLARMKQAKKAVVIASLPEYWLYHWGPNMAKFAEWGVDGFEIATSAPPAMDFTPRLRKEMVDFCRKRNLCMTGITDNHGWGFSCYLWNVIQMKGWRKQPLEKLEPMVIDHLQRKKFGAVQVLARIKHEPSGSALELCFDPFLQFWEAARSMPLSHAAVSIGWFLAICFFKIRKFGNPKILQ